jgi:hypothetical protein
MLTSSFLSATPNRKHRLKQTALNTAAFKILLEKFSKCRLGKLKKEVRVEQQLGY